MLADRQIAERGEVADRSWVGGDSQLALIDDQVDQRRAVGSCSDCQVIEHRLLPPLACCPLPTNQSDTVKPGQRKDVSERGNRRIYGERPRDRLGNSPGGQEDSCNG